MYIALFQPFAALLRRRLNLVRLAAFACALAALPSSAAAAPRLAPITSLSAPVFVTHARDQRLFIVQKGGQIRIYDKSSNSLLATPFLNIQSKVSSGSEQGLLSMAFHPDYAANGYFYVNYTNLAGATVIERYRVSSNPNLATSTSGVTLLLIARSLENHNGGQLQVSPSDGYLYIAMGDGGGGGDPNCLAQRRDTLLGKMLRLDVRANLNQAPYYGIPPSNPFIGASDPGGQIADEIWAFGLRNPWRFSFDRANGDLYIGDVGQNAYEEISLQRGGTPGGRNFGWRSMEGLHCYDTNGCPAYVPSCNSPALTLPIHEFNHDNGDCSVIGGYFYRGSRVPELVGRYVFADFCASALRTLREGSPGVWQSNALLPAPGSPTSFGEDSDGEIYVTIDDQVVRIESTVPFAAVPAGNSWWLMALAACLMLVGVYAGMRRASRRSGP